MARTAIALNGVSALATLIRVINKNMPRESLAFCSYHSLEKIGKRWRPRQKGTELPAQLSPEPATLPLRLLLPLPRAVLAFTISTEPLPGFSPGAGATHPFRWFLPAEPSGRGCRPYWALGWPAARERALWWSAEPHPLGESATFSFVSLRVLVWKRRTSSSSGWSGSSLVDRKTSGLSLKRAFFSHPPLVSCGLN